MADDAAFIWETPTPPLRPRRNESVVPTPSDSDRITLRDAEQRFGVKVTTLRTWARKGSIDAIRADSNQWLVTPESVAHHLSRKRPQVSTSPGPTRTGPSDDGSAMLVPRDAWDKLMDQLGNLHESGLQLAEARERAAKAETEVTFLRERLSEIRSERDDLRTTATPTHGSNRSGRWPWLRSRRSDRPTD
jgi:DNA-binding transcriptional MerR regulator